MQRVSTELRNLELHDAGLFAIQHIVEEGKLIFKVKFSENDEGILHKAYIIFYDVAAIASNPNFEAINWIDTFGNVSLVQHIPSIAIENLEGIRWYITLIDNIPRPYSDMVLEFLSSGFTVEMDAWEWDEEAT